jgi:hypothetical protein
VCLSFSLKYLVGFTKATGLSGKVRLSLSAEVPLLVEYALANNSYLRFYLAPKVRVLVFMTIMLTQIRLATKSSRPRSSHERLDGGLS